MNNDINAIKCSVEPIAVTHIANEVAYGELLPSGKAWRISRCLSSSRLKTISFFGR